MNNETNNNTMKTSTNYNRISEAEFGMNFTQLTKAQQEWCIENPNVHMNEACDKQRSIYNAEDLISVK